MSTPSRLFWVDFETPCLPTRGSFANVPVLQVGAIITDLNLTRLSGFHETLPMTPEAADQLRANPEVLAMHRESGLIKDAVEAAKIAKLVKGGRTLAKVEDDLIDMLKDYGTKGGYMIAGSGVAAFDRPLIAQKMPRLDEWLAYYPFDIGVMRRVSKTLAGGRDVVNPTLHSYGPSKRHRAFADVEAHIEEALSFQQFFARAMHAVDRGLM